MFTKISIRLGAMEKQTEVIQFPITLQQIDFTLKLYVVNIYRDKFLIKNLFLGHIIIEGQRQCFSILVN